MPDAPMRPCAGSCGRLVKAGRCPACSTRNNRQRREGRGFDYSQPWWRNWRVNVFIPKMTSLGIPPVCGATLPGGPSNHVSQCANAQEGERREWTGASADGSSLHFHHEPELTDAELVAIKAGNRAIAADETRIVLACRECHSAETMRGRKRRAA